MTDETSPRFGLPLLAAGQAQKEIAHNEAVTVLEALVQPVAQTIGDASPPAAPQPGQCWIVGDVPTGAWAGQAGQVACRTAGGWRFVAPVEGMALWVAATGLTARRVGGTWTTGTVPATQIVVGGQQVVGARRAAIPAPAGGATIDAEARTSIAAVLGALQAHGLIAA